MPNAWSMIDSSFPTFRGDESYKDQVLALQDYLYLLVEELKYQLANLKADNWNTVALEKFQKDTTADTDEQVAELAKQLTNVANRLTALSGDLSKLSDRVGTAEETIKVEIPKLWEGLELLAGDLDDLGEIIRPDGSGGATIGREGTDLHLVGNVYINGILVEAVEDETTPEDTTQ